MFGIALGSKARALPRSGFASSRSCRLDDPTRTTSRTRPSRATWSAGGSTRLAPGGPCRSPSGRAGVRPAGSGQVPSAVTGTHLTAYLGTRERPRPAVAPRRKPVVRTTRPARAGRRTPCHASPRGAVCRRVLRPVRVRTGQRVEDQTDSSVSHTAPTWRPFDTGCSAAGASPRLGPAGHEGTCGCAPSAIGVRWAAHEAALLACGFRRRSCAWSRGLPCGCRRKRSGGCRAPFPHPRPRRTTSARSGLEPAAHPGCACCMRSPIFSLASIAARCTGLRGRRCAPATGRPRPVRRVCSARPAHSRDSICSSPLDAVLSRHASSITRHRSTKQGPRSLSGRHEEAPTVRRGIRTDRR